MEYCAGGDVFMAVAGDADVRVTFYTVLPYAQQRELFLRIASNRRRVAPRAPACRRWPHKMVA